MTKSFFKKLIERSVKTFVQAFAAALIVPADLFNENAWRAAAFAAVAAGLSAIISLISRNVGPDKNSPSVV